MLKLGKTQQKIVAIFIKNQSLSSSDVYQEILKEGEDISLVTIKRMLTGLVDSGFLKIFGSGRSTAYSISVIGRVFAGINAEEYCLADPDKRYGLKNYNFDLLPDFPADILTSDEINILEDATAGYKQRSEDLSDNIRQKELERLIIELSWKSSKIEGNTYTLLDTEKLILENKVAPGKRADETLMILNHKDAFDFVCQNASQFRTVNRKNLEKVHSLLVKGLNIDSGFRNKPVGVVGSSYRPLDNIHQIQEAIVALEKAVDRLASPYAKALLALMGLSYIQPFEDGNKRTSRLMANAILLAYDLAPLSYRSVEEKDYREAILVFYELNAISPFKKIFIEQYVFAAKNYAYYNKVIA
ncbi:MAG: Fic family protein [Patescibacteria group bacterium]|jgi:Fic family protein